MWAASRDGPIWPLATSPEPRPDIFGGSLWYLEGFGDGRRLRRVPILSFPFTIGRRPGLDLSLEAAEISQHHASISASDGRLVLRDLGSTNGTFLNQRRLSGDAPLREGDVLHFATAEFRLGRLNPGHTELLLGATRAVQTPLPQLLVERTQRLRELLAKGAVYPLFQPIVDLADGRPVAYEVLGRGGLDGLPADVGELFELAAFLGAEPELSRLLRTVGVAGCARLPAVGPFFLNTHPAELREEGLIGSLREIRRRQPELPLVLEIHESAVTDPASMVDLKGRLSELRIGLAYDDFGAGQARLTELAEAPPDYLKFDMAMIQGTDASPAKRRMVEALVAMAVDLGIEPIAEGVETELDAETCAAMGFRLAQGYLYGQPAPPAEAAG